MLPNENGAERGLEEMAETGLDPIAPKCPLSLSLPLLLASPACASPSAWLAAWLSG